MSMTQTHTASAHTASAVPGTAFEQATEKAMLTMPSDKGEHPLHDLVMSQLDDDQAQEIVSIPLEGKSSVADFMVVASGRSTRQVASIAQKLSEKVKQAGLGPVRIEGLPAADWVLVDAGDVVVHLFRPEVRTFYNLERMWAFEGGQPQQGRA